MTVTAALADRAVTTMANKSKLVEVVVVVVLLGVLSAVVLHDLAAIIHAVTVGGR